MRSGRAAARWARSGWLVPLALLVSTGCALTSSSLGGASAIPTDGQPLVLGELREPHAEPELIALRHTVAPGETLYRIALNHGVSVEALASANGIDDPRSLSVGQELIIPHTELRPVPVASESSPTPSRAPSASSRPASAARPTGKPGAKGASARPVPETKGTLDWPLRGVLYARFGKKGREPHDGIDLAVPAGTPVKTAQEGEVLYAGEQRGYGLIVIVRHSEHLITLYAHNRDLRVSTGQKVRRAQVIATVGESGKTSGPQLHFEVRVEGKPVDPLDYLGPLPAS
ncbi:peptidoglycan DD-metalloendopeptidase family protein [Melittangium boletus]|uniref:peptidoglycan DD-metalloendopeptidase family protein n=1 Tax=Melittangium boletus TaxID=83453 RepID=UPI003DA254BD